MNDFDKQFSRMTSAIFALWAIGIVLAIGSLAFFAWVIVQLLQYFAVI